MQEQQDRRNRGTTATRPEYLDTPVRQSRFILVFVVSAVLTSLVLTYVYSEKYESYTVISYRTQEVTRFKAQQNESLGSPAPQAPFKVISQTLQEVLKSDAILLDVVKDLQLDVKKTGYEGPWYKVAYEWTKDTIKEYGGYAWMLLKYGRIIEENVTAAAVEELRNNIKVKNRDSYVFHLYVRDKYPERAALITDRLGKILANWLLEFDRQPGRMRQEQLQTLLEEKNQTMQQRRQEIETLLTSNQLASVQMETERLTDRLSQLQLERSRLGSEIERSRSRLAGTESKLAVKSKVLAEPETGTGERLEYIQPEDFKKLSSQRVFENLELKSLMAQENSLRESIAVITARLSKLPGLQNRIDTLRFDLVSLEREYNLLNDAYQEAAVRTTSGVSEVRVLHPAIIPSEPVTPIKFYHVMLAGGLGILFSAGLVYLLTFLNLRLLFPSLGIHGRRQTSEPSPPPVSGTENKSKEINTRG